MPQLWSPRTDSEVAGRVHGGGWQKGADDSHAYMGRFADTMSGSWINFGRSPNGSPGTSFNITTIVSKAHRHAQSATSNVCRLPNQSASSPFAEARDPTLLQSCNRHPRSDFRGDGFEEEDQALRSSRP